MRAIILSRRDFREFDQIISLYTKERGKLDLLARGIKKITSKQTAHCEPFSYCMIDAAAGKEIDHLIKVVPIDLFAQIRAHMQKSLVAGYVVSFLQKMTDVGVADTSIWNTTLTWIQFLEKFSVVNLDNSEKLVNLVDGYIVTLLHCLGFKPVLERCVVCNKSFQELVKEELESQMSKVKSQMSGMYFAGGGILCPACRSEKNRVGEDIASCGLKEISNLQLLLTGNWDAVVQSPVSENEKKAIHGLVFAYAQYHCEKKIGDWGGWK